MKKVLIVEDNDLNLKLFCDLLTIKKCKIIVSKDGTDVMNIVSKELPDLILMDIQLNSGVSGIDLIKKLKYKSPTKLIPIIAITAFARKTDEKLITKSGCDMYISKPVSIKHFFQAIDSFIDSK